MPDRIHFRQVRCVACGLIRSDPAIDAKSLRQLYGKSTFDYGSELDGLRSTYRRYLQKARNLGGRQQSLLEIGCGNGFFLEEALTNGYSDVSGVEPSSSAVAAASPSIRPYIVCDVMGPGLFPDGSFDAVCLFQVFDHLPDPGAVLDASLKVLRSGGVLLCLNHNVNAWSSRLMRERSPIVDVEHPYLYSPGTIAHIFSQHGYRVLEQGRVFNTAAVRYLAQLLPIPTAPRRRLIKILRTTGLGRVKLRLPLGNLYLIAQKPSSEPASPKQRATTAD